MLIVNNSKKPLPIAADVVLYPGLPAEVNDWQSLRKLPVVASWLKARIISEIDQTEPAKPHPQEPVTAEKKDDALSELEEYGIQKNRWVSLGSMQHLLARAKQKNESD